MTYQNYLENPETFPVSFVYEGRTYKGFQKGFRELSRTAWEERGGTRTVIVLEHLDSGTHFTLDTVVYPDYRAYDWTISIENTSSANTGVFQQFCAADMNFQGGKPVLKGLSGDAPLFYLPYETDLRNNSISFETTGGRPTHGAFPYYNLEYGSGGALIAIGWPGNWRTDFTGQGDTTHFTGGLNGFQAYLKPGETVRMPLMAFVFYEGRDGHAATNAWRRWFIDCNMRKIEGENFAPVLAASNMADGFTTAKHLRVLDLYERNGIHLDYYWIDAGWYTDAEGQSVSWPSTGTLQIDLDRYPDRFRDISDRLGQHGGKLLLWFEPEVIRVDRESFLKNITDFSEEWMLGRVMQGTWLEGELMDLGNPECVGWLLDKISAILEEGGVSLYRQDFNVDPAPAWQAGEEPDRQGITENQYCQGYLALWDGLIERFPDMMIDSCASGGGRNDLESMRRSVPLHITDLYDGNDNQYTTKNAMSQAVFAWFPYFKSQFSGGEPDLYRLRSNYAPWFNFSPSDMASRDFQWQYLVQAQEEWNRIKQYFYAEYYPLLEWSREADSWKGWQFQDPESNSGFVQLMRPAGCDVSDMTIKLYGLDRNTTYRLTDFDGVLSVSQTGAELMDRGLSVTLPSPEYAMVILLEPA